jgi:erythromycin esterase-like protein
VDRFVRGASGASGASGVMDDRTPEDALSGFRRFPAWMWRNADVVDFVGWLREHNRTHAHQQAGFYGLDLYSLYTSIDEVLGYLDKVDPAAAQRARERYGCFGAFEESSEYGYATGAGFAEPCDEKVTEQLAELERRAVERFGEGVRDGDDLFDAEQNARLVRNAERYYREMYRGHVSSWNLRDTHMVDTLNALVAHLGKKMERPKVVVWAHNSHLGDARATSMGDMGELNVGQLVRERYGEEAVLVGFSTHHGTVTAASDWGKPAERKRVRPALDGSWEDVMHAADLPRFLLLLRGMAGRLPELRERRLERAIGVIYMPRTERRSHYFDAALAAQFDALIHVDETRAVEPLERDSEWDTGEPPETYPVAV